MRLRDFVSLRARMIGAVILIALLCGTPSSVGAQARVGVGAPGAGAPSIQSISKLTVFDAHGLEVGVLGNTLFQVNGRIVGVGVAPQGFVGFGRSFLLFENLDCQGPPFLSSSDDLAGFVTISALGPPGATVYLPDPAATSAVKDFKSFLQFPLPHVTIFQHSAPLRESRRCRSSTSTRSSPLHSQSGQPRRPQSPLRSSTTCHRAIPFSRSSRRSRRRESRSDAASRRRSSARMRGSHVVRRRYCSGKG